MLCMPQKLKIAIHLFYVVVSPVTWTPSPRIRKHKPAGGRSKFFSSFNKKGKWEVGLRGAERSWMAGETMNQHHQWACTFSSSSSTSASQEEWEARLSGAQWSRLSGAQRSWLGGENRDRQWHTKVSVSSHIRLHTLVVVGQRALEWLDEIGFSK